MSEIKIHKENSNKICVGLRSGSWQKNFFLELLYQFHFYIFICIDLAFFLENIIVHFYFFSKIIKIISLKNFTIINIKKIVHNGMILSQNSIRIIFFNSNSK